MKDSLRDALGFFEIFCTVECRGRFFTTNISLNPIRSQIAAHSAEYEDSQDSFRDALGFFEILWDCNDREIFGWVQIQQTLLESLKNLRERNRHHHSSEAISRILWDSSVRTSKSESQSTEIFGDSSESFDEHLEVELER